MKPSTDKRLDWPSDTRGQSQQNKQGGKISSPPISDVTWAIDATQLGVRFGATVALRDRAFKWNKERYMPSSAKTGPVSPPFLVLSPDAWSRTLEA